MSIYTHAGRTVTVEEKIDLLMTEREILRNQNNASNLLIESQRQRLNEASATISQLRAALTEIAEYTGIFDKAGQVVTTPQSIAKASLSNQTK